MTLQEIGAFIRDVGFPAFMSIYLVVALGPKIDKLTNTITKLVTLHEGAEK